MNNIELIASKKIINFINYMYHGNSVVSYMQLRPYQCSTKNEADENVLFQVSGASCPIIKPHLPLNNNRTSLILCMT